MRFLIIQTGTTLPAIRAAHGDFPDWIRRDMELAPEQVHTVRVDTGGTLPDTSRYTGALVTGSGAMVSEREDWSERTAEWLRGATAAGLPMLGLCYGHQLLAHALGGTVGFNPLGREIGSVDVTCLPAATDDALLGNMRSTFRAQTSHLQSVLELPPAARNLACSALEEHQAVRYAPRVWGVQFHPEFSIEVMRGYISGRADTLRSEGLDPVALTQRVDAAPEARDLLQRFARIARKVGGAST